MKAARISHQVGAGSASGPLPDALAQLLTASAYPHPVDAVSVIETPQWSYVPYPWEEARLQLKGPKVPAVTVPLT
jgi:hypothetical protein